MKRTEFGNLIVDLGKSEAIIKREELIPRETFKNGDRVRAYIYDVKEDSKGYHRSLAVAMNPDKFAQFFYDQGVSNTVDNVSRKSKNINMNVRQSPQTITKDGMKIRAVGNTDSGRGLRIRSIKRS